MHGPRVRHGPPAEIHWLEVDHPAAADGGGRGHSEIVDLEHHRHRRGQLDALAVVEAERLVVVEYR
eukprot:2786361-Rhodomonas_salina.1